MPITKYEATRRKPDGPKARHVRVPSKKAAAMPDRDKPETRIGMPRMKIRRLLSREDFHVGGEDWTNLMACCIRLRSLAAADGVANIFLGDFGLGFREKVKSLKGIET